MGVKIVDYRPIIAASQLILVWILTTVLMFTFTRPFRQFIIVAMPNRLLRAIALLVGFLVGLAIFLASPFPIKFSVWIPFFVPMSAGLLLAVLCGNQLLRTPFDRIL